MKTKHIGLAITAFIATTVISPQIQAAFPGKNGLIAFHHVLGWPSMELQVMNPDGSDRHLLISSSLSSPAGLSWSPDGKKFTFHQGVFVPREIWTANSDGTDLIKITDDGYDDEDPTWSSSGTKIVVGRGINGHEIYVMNADGSNPIRLTDNAEKNAHPQWSPNGNMITFMSERDGNPEIYVMNADGSKQTRLTNNPEGDDYPNWSPDGLKIIFHTGRDGNGEIYMMNGDGSHLINLTNNPASDMIPKWSPDGTKIAFTRDQTCWVMNPDGSEQTQLTADQGFCNDWQPIPIVVNSTQLISLGDINKDNSPEIAVVSYKSTVKKSIATVKNAQTGALVKQIAFNGQFIPTKANILPDLNGNGAVEIAVLGVRSSDQAVQVEVRDSLSGVKLSAVPFDSTFTPIDLGIVRDISGKGTAGLAVLQQNDTELRVQLKDALSGVQIGNITFSGGYKGIDLIVLGDLNGNRAKEIAVLADNKIVTAADTVEIRDSKTGQLIRTISYGIGKDLQQLINLPDLNNSSGAELAVLRANTARVLVKDAKTGLVVNTLNYVLPQPFRLATVADSNSQTNLAMLGLRRANGQPRADVHDPLSDTFINKVVFDNYGATVGFIAIPDINGNGVAELVRLREQPGPQKLFAEIRDGRTGELLQGMYF